MLRRIKFNSEKCCGCKTCELVCSEKNEGVFNIALSRIIVNTIPEKMRFEARYCLQCKNAQCMKVCPSDALYRDENGIVKIKHDLCLACKACINACPFGGITYFEDKVIKCELCNGEPKCVKHCPTSALTY
jgi:carbon-monoxide dehydrogenase iron sulfur subunit